MINRSLKQFLLLLISGIICLFPVHHAHSKITKTIKTELNNDAERFYIGDNAYITPNTEESLSAHTIGLRHTNNLRGQKTTRKTILIENTAKPSWLVFAVTNNTRHSDWVLDLGTALSGRTGLLQHVSLYDFTNGLSFLDTEIATSPTHALTQPIPVTLKPNQTSLFVLKILTGTDQPATITPSFMKNTTISVWPASFTNSVLFMFFASVCVFFITTTALRKHRTYLLFLPYYLLYGAYAFLTLCIHNLPANFSGELLIIIPALISVVTVILTRFFLKIRTEEYIYNNLFLIALFLVLAGTACALLLPDHYYGLRNVLSFFIPAMAPLICSVIAFTAGKKGKRYAYPYSLSLIIITGGILISGLALNNTIPTTALTINGLWIAFFLHTVGYVWATFSKIRTREDEKRYMQLRENRQARSMARLQHSKESADQARLLRVIERERELMAELRERETLRTKEMRKAKDQADEANRSKSAFLAVVSHEIRTPMTAILGMVRLLNDTYMNKQQSDYVFAIKQSGETMLALLNDILDFEKIERDGLDIEEIDFDLTKLIQSIVMLMSGHADEKNISLQTDLSDDLPRYVIGDPTRLRQVLLNLVSNAIKFTDHGSVTIRVYNDNMTIDDRHSLSFAVEDTGIGISKKAIQSLFRPFAQAEKSITRKYGGTGLGLTICKKLIEKMGGEIKVKSEEAIGSSFYFTVLMPQGSEQQAQIYEKEENNTHYDMTPMNVLIIEDNAMNQKVIRGFLEKDNHTMTITDSAEEGLKTIAQNTFDVILSDINLEDMSGIEFVQHLRQNNIDIPIIALTGNVADHDIERYYEAGFNGFVAKPIHPNQLHHALHKVQTGNYESRLQNQTQHTTSTAAPSNTNDFGFELDELDSAFDDGFDDDFDFFPDNQTQNMDENSILNITILKNLYDTIGKEQCEELLDGYQETADAIIEQLTNTQDGDTIEARAHELKGMAGNFGVASISIIAGDIEKACQDKNLDQALTDIKKLAEINEEAKTAMADWLSSLS